MGKFKIDKRSLKYGSNSVILVAVVVAIIIVINLLVGMGEFKLDLTSEKQYSISDQTKKILKDIKKEDVTIYGLFDDGQVSSNQAYNELLNLVDGYKKLGIQVKYIDPAKDPGTIRSFDENGTKGIAKGDFVVKCGKKVKKLSASDLYGQDSQYGRLSRAEPLITGAIKYVTSAKTPVAYFVEGHNELSLAKDMTQMKMGFENNNLETKTLSLLSETKIPDDCEILIFASPKKDLTEDERVKVQAYLKKGGKAVFLMDPVETGTKFANFEEVLAAYNVAMNYDKVKENDQNRHLPQDEYAVASTLENNQINEAFSGSDYVVLFPDTRSLSIIKSPKDYLTTTSLIKTSDKSESSDIVSQGNTKQGPFDLAIASEIKGSSKILVFGNGQFMTDTNLQSQYSQYYSNDCNYLLNTVVNWMQDKKDETTIESKLITQKALSVTSGQTSVIGIMLMALLPLIIIGTGFVVWLRRRHL